MMLNLRPMCFTAVFLLAGITAFSAGSSAPPSDSLRFAKSEQKFNIVELEMTAQLYKRVQTVKGIKLDLKNTALKFNGDAVTLKDLHLHGNTTLNFERKSFSVDAEQKVKICEKGCKPMDAFYLISLSMDKNYFHNRLCFDLLKDLDLFHLDYAYAEVRINGNSQGIYLMVQRPQDWSKKEAGSPFILRRGIDHAIVKEKAGKEVDKEAVKEYRHQFATIYKVIYQLSGDALYEKLNELMDIDQYMRWLALNYIVKNGDYSDELYFYIHPETKRFQIIPWDYDDVFKPEPHEGMATWRAKMNPASLIFSSEDVLDVQIAHDPVLYAKYRAHLADVMNALTEKKVESVLNKLYRDLSALYEADGVLETVKMDGYTTSIAKLQAELETVDQYFSYMRTFLKK